MDQTPPRIDISIREVEDGFIIRSDFESVESVFVSKSIEDVCIKVKEIYNLIHK